jgi:hypothetical protein
VTAAHVYDATPDDPPGSARVRIETRPTVQTWLPGEPVIPGRIWCWTHQAWETLPAETPSPAGGSSGDDSRTDPSRRPA